MAACLTHNYKLYIKVNNFKTQNTELDFGDFKIISVSQGHEAREWRKKLGCKGVPGNILIKEFPNYRMDADDISGSDKIIESSEDLLLIFRLFKIGDIMFDDVLIEDLEGNIPSYNQYRSAKPSLFKYDFGQDEIEGFKNFRNNLTNKNGYGNKFYKFSLNYFMSGGNKDFFYRIENLERIVDYIIALESLFLIDNPKDFLKRTITERISRFLEDDRVGEIVKFMYDERSNIVHGNYIGLQEKKRSGKIANIEKYMSRFEDLIRKVFVRLFDFNFSEKKEIVNFMKELYGVPSESLEIMKKARNEAGKYLNL